MADIPLEDEMDASNGGTDECNLAFSDGQVIEAVSVARGMLPTHWYSYVKAFVKFDPTD